jgi:hypothetical protein
MAPSRLRVYRAHMGSSPPSGGAKQVYARSGGMDSAAARRVIIALAIGVVVGSVVATAAFIVEPSTDAADATPPGMVEPSGDAGATLEPTGVPPDELILRLLEPPEATHLEIDLATLRGFGEHDGVDVWSASNAFGSPCLIAIHRETADVLGTSCVPAGATTFVDTRWHGLPVGAAYRFTLHGDAVDVHLLLPTEAP